MYGILCEEHRGDGSRRAQVHYLSNDGHNLRIECLGDETSYPIEMNPFVLKDICMGCLFEKLRRRQLAKVAAEVNEGDLEIFG